MQRQALAGWYWTPTRRVSERGLAARRQALAHASGWCPKVTDARSKRGPSLKTGLVQKKLDFAFAIRNNTNNASTPPNIHAPIRGKPTDDGAIPASPL